MHRELLALNTDMCMVSTTMETARQSMHVTKNFSEIPAIIPFSPVIEQYISDGTKSFKSS